MTQSSAKFTYDDLLRLPPDLLLGEERSGASADR
jgi:hypothetical protein